MRPTLPRIPRGNVNMLSVVWITKLIACVKYAMDYPMGDGKSTYRDGGTISALRQPANSLGGTADNYKGYFKVVDISALEEETWKLIVAINDGRNDTLLKCGFANINNTIFDMDSEELEIEVDDEYIYMQSIYDPATGVTGVPTFECSSALPAYAANTFVRLLATIEFDDSKIYNIFQQQHGAINGYTFGDCT